MKEVQKNTQEKIRVEKRKYKGREFVDVRTYYLIQNHKIPQILKPLQEWG